MITNYKQSVSGRSVVNSGITDDYKQAIVEYIWNGFDAGATTVNICYEVANELGNLRSFSILDNGKGINRSSLEHTFGSFLDSQKRHSYQRTSDFRGRKGKGRFSFKSFATAAEWITRYVDEETNELRQYSIIVDMRDLSTYSVSDEEVLNSTEYSTGTEVRFFNINNLSEKSLTNKAFHAYIAQEYAWFLRLNEPRGYQLCLNGVPFAYDNLVGIQEEIKLDIRGVHFEITFIRWSKKISDKFYYYMMDSDLKENFKELTSFNNNTIGFYHSVYVKSDYFKRFIYEKKPHPRYDGMANQCDFIYKSLIKNLKAFLATKVKEFVKQIAAEKLIASYESNGIFPDFKQNPYDQARKRDLTETIKSIYAIQPKIFKGLKKDQQKTFVAFLNLLLDSDERDKILQIMEDIVKMTDEEKSQLVKVLHTTSMSNINRVVNMMSNRLEVVECLKLLVYDVTKFTTERDHIQKIIEQNYWLFGEQFNLVSADETFEKALSKYLYALDGIAQQDKPFINNGDRNRRPDIFICRQRLVNDAHTYARLQENIIVELKRPSVNIGVKQYRQIEDYFQLIKQEPNFNSQTRIWKFFVIGNAIEESVKGYYERCKPHNKRYLVNIENNFEIYAMSWDDVFQEFEYTHDFILDKLNFDKGAIKARIDEVKSDVASANSLTQKILSLETN